MFFPKVILQTPCCPDTQEYLSSYGETPDMTLQDLFPFSTFFCCNPSRVPEFFTFLVKPMPWWYKRLHELTMQVSLYGCPGLMLLHIWYWEVPSSEKRMHQDLGWCRVALLMSTVMCTWRREPLLCDILVQHNPDLSHAIFPTESIKSRTTDMRHIGLYVRAVRVPAKWHCVWQRISKSWPDFQHRQYKHHAGFELKNLNYQTGPTKPPWELTAQLSTGDSVRKCWYYCRIPIQVSWRWQVIFCHKQYDTLVQTNVACDGPTPTAEKLDSANVLSIWNLNLSSVPPGCIWLQDKQLPRQQKSKQTEHHTQRSPLNVFTNSEGSYSLPCQWINKRVQLLINGTRLALSYTTIIISCRKGSQSQSTRVMSATKVTQQIIYCFLRAGKALEAKGVSKLSFERQWKKNLRWRFSELTKALSYTILIHLNILSASKTCHLKYLLEGLFVNWQHPQLES